MNVRNINLAPRSTSFFALIILVVFALGIVALMQMGKLRDSEQDVETNWMASVREIGKMQVGILRLRLESVRLTLTRLISEWHSGKNRFNAPGECLMAAYSNQQLAGIGGLSIDPYNQPDTARLRRLYVAPAARNQHVGQALVKALVAQAALHFQKVRLCTDTSRGDAFYLRCGFMRIEDVHATHIIELGNA